jgi:ABC-2 type transport system ATP-binding protein
MYPAEEVIEIRNVSKSFKDVRAVVDLSLTVRQGEFLALLGPNGAGKTTLVEMVEGLQHPDKGEILILNNHWSGHKDFLHQVIGISLQETRFIDKLTVREILMLFTSFYKAPADRVQEIISLTGLEEKAKSYTVNLSGGQRQKLALGIALINKPRILLLDEPTTGLDPSSRREIWKILLDLKKHEKTTMILTTHYMEEASYLCDKIVIMDRGRILAGGTLHELLTNYNPGEIIEFVPDDAGRKPDFKGLSGIRNVEWDPQTGKCRLIINSIIQTLPEFLQYTSSTGYGFKSLECRKMTLEDLFVEMTGRKLSDNDQQP